MSGPLLGVKPRPKSCDGGRRHAEHGPWVFCCTLLPFVRFVVHLRGGGEGMGRYGGMKATTSKAVLLPLLQFMDKSSVALALSPSLSLSTEKRVPLFHPLYWRT